MPGQIYKIAQGEFAQANNKKKRQGSKALNNALSPEAVLKVIGNEKLGKSSKKK